MRRIKRAVPLLSAKQGGGNREIGTHDRLCNYSAHLWQETYLTKTGKSWQEGLEIKLRGEPGISDAWLEAETVEMDGARPFAYLK
jgi:hypothetical protein